MLSCDSHPQVFTTENSIEKFLIALKGFSGKFSFHPRFSMYKEQNKLSEKFLLGMEKNLVSKPIKNT